jgi:hypothetical protein
VRFEQTADLAVADEGLEPVSRVVADVCFRRTPETLHGILRGRDRGVVRGEHVLHGGDHDLGEDALFGFDVLVQAGASHADGSADVGHGGGLVAFRGEQFERCGTDVAGPVYVTSWSLRLIDNS